MNIKIANEPKVKPNRVYFAHKAGKNNEKPLYDRVAMMTHLDTDLDQ